MHKEKREGSRKLEEIIVENFPNLRNETDVLVQEAKGAPKKTDTKRSILRHMITKIQKLKIENLKSSKRKIK